MNRLVKIIVDEGGEPVIDPVWCLSVIDAGSNMAFCSGEFYGFAEVQSDEAEHIEKYVLRGGITCEMCLEKIRRIKAVKL